MGDFAITRVPASIWRIAFNSFTIELEAVAVRAHKAAEGRNVRTAPTLL